MDVRPRFEGSNICTWIGFKHVMYLLEEAVLDHLRQTGRVPRRLYEELGLSVDIVDSDARILHALHMDDLVHAEVRPEASGGPDLVFAVTLHVEREHQVKAVTATVRVVLRRVPDAPPVPAELAPHVVDEIRRAASGPAAAGNGRVTPPQLHGGDGVQPLGAGRNGIAWTRTIPYFYCHYSERLQHSGYLRLMEEVVDRFLASRGISIRDMLRRQQWIPVVPHARVEILREALMEEEIHTVFAVEDVFKDVTYRARMDCWVRRGDEIVHTATGSITHGYAVIEDRANWRLVSFDERTLEALRSPHAADAAPARG